MKLRALGAVLVVMAATACSGTSTPTTQPTADTTTTLATTTVPPGTSTTASPTTSVAAETTTTGGNVVDEAEGSGCTPGEGALPDGEWFGYVATVSESQLEFDLACWFAGEAAVRAAAEDGEESPPPNDYYVRNASEVLRAVPVAADTEVTWYPNVGDPTSETTSTFTDWITDSESRDIALGVWLDVQSGTVVEIREQWIP